MIQLHVFRTHRQHEQKIDVSNGTTLGSGSYCDYRFNDPHMSEIHARVVEEAGQLWLVDADSDNGIRNRFGISMGGRIALTPGTRFELGEHSFEVHGTSTESEASAAGPLPPSLAFVLPLSLVLLVMIVGMKMFEVYLQTPVDDYHLWPTFRNVVFSQGPLFVMAGGAYLVGVLLRGRGYFMQILALCLGVTVAKQLISFFILLFDYNVGSSIVLDAVEFAFDLGVMLIALYLGLKWISHWRQKRLILACGFFFSLVVANAYIDLVEANSNEFNLRQYNDRIFSSDWRFVSAKTKPEWSGSIEELFSSVESNADWSDENAEDSDSSSDESDQAAD